MIELPYIVIYSLKQNLTKTGVIILLRVFLIMKHVASLLGKEVFSVLAGTATFAQK